MNFKQYLNESTLGGQKGGSDYKYLGVLLNSIQDKREIFLGTNGETSTYFEYTDELKQIHDITKTNFKLAGKYLKDSDDKRFKYIFKDKSGKLYKFSEIFKGQFSQSKDTAKNKVIFSAGNNTKTGESLQIIGLFMNIGKDTEFNYNGASHKLMLKLIKKLDLADGEGFIKKYMSTESDFKKFSASIQSILYSSSLAANSLRTKLNYDSVIHRDISKFYTITAEKGLTDKDISKANTADCILYNGKNLLDNIKNPKSIIKYESHTIKVLIDDKVKNEFIQISLKSGVRLGDLSTFTKIANKHKYFIYEELSSDITNEGFGSFIKNLINKTKNIVIKINNTIKNILGKLQKDINKLDTNYNNIAINLFNNINEMSESNLIIEAKGQRVPTQDDIFKKFSSKTEFKKLVKRLESGLIELRINMSKIGTGVISKIPNYSVPKNPTAEELRFIYFNTVSILTMIDYIKTLKNGASDVQDLEIEMLYGNTILPLVKVFTDYTNPIEYLPIKHDKGSSKGNIPIFGLLVNTKDNKYLVFYIHILSTTHTAEPTYLKIQMRTKGNQYVVDGQSLISYNSMIKSYN